MLGLLGLVVAANAEGVSWVDAFSVLLLILCGILLLTFGLLQLYAWLNRNRAHRLTETYSGAFIAIVPTDPALVSGANAFARQSTGARTRLCS